MPPILTGEILVVEDERAAAQLLKLNLESAGFGIHAENTGEAAVRYAADHQPDLAILDLKLPDISGYEVCRKLRKMYPELPTLMLTGLSEPVDQLRGFAYGADAYLTKPFELKELLKIISALMGKWPRVSS